MNNKFYERKVQDSKNNRMQLVKYFRIKIKITLSFAMVLLSLLIHATNATQLFTDQTLHTKQSSSAITHWSEVDLVYYKDFPYTGYKHYQPVNGCSLIHRQIKGRPSTVSGLLRCVEQIHLLLPEVKAETLREEQQVKGYLDPGADDNLMAGHASYGIHAYIALIKPVSLHADLLHGAKNKQLVRALFIRHALNVKAYQFKNIITGSISTIKATDNHPFYLENKKAFVPIGHVSSSDRLITATGQSVKLVCPENRKEHCGAASVTTTPVLVYNLEINQKHTYFVGNNIHILVHNCANKVKDAISHAYIDKTQAVRLGSFNNGGGIDFEAEYYDLNNLRELFLRQTRVYLYDKENIPTFSSPYSREKVDVVENFFHEEKKPLDIFLMKLNNRGKFVDIESFSDPVYNKMGKQQRELLRKHLFLKFAIPLQRLDLNISIHERDLAVLSSLSSASDHEKQVLGGILDDARKKRARVIRME